MPTRHPRHTLTETPDLSAALAQARKLLPDVTDGQRLRHLVMLGASTLADQAERDRRESRRRAQLAFIESGGREDELVIVLRDVLDCGP